MLLVYKQCHAIDMSILCTFITVRLYTDGIMLSFIIALVLTYTTYGCHSDCCKNYATDCQDYQDKGHTTSGVYHVTPTGTRTGFDVYCDMATDGGGWLVFQRRVDGTLNFYRDWRDYTGGFGENKSHEYWLGLLPLKRLLCQGHYELRIDLEDFDGNVTYAKYDTFDIGDFTENYTLKVSDYSGTAGDSLTYHNGHMFSTRDADNDDHPDNCAQRFNGAWWYNYCHQSNLNGLYLHGSYAAGESDADGVFWHKFRGLNYSLKTTEMKIRRA